MEDLVPFLIFIVIVIINLVKFVAEKGGKKKQAPTPSGTAPPKRQPTTLESFFEELAEKLELKCESIETGEMCIGYSFSTIY